MVNEQMLNKKEEILKDDNKKAFLLKIIERIRNIENLNMAKLPEFTK